MSHVDPEVLALLALGEPAGTDTERAHAAECAECAAEVAGLAAVVRVGREARDEELVAPPSSVWSRIQADLADDDAPPLAPVVPLRRRVPWALVGAAAGLVVGAGGAALVLGQDATEPADRTEVVAEATLEPLPGWSAEGSAVVEQRPDGARVLVLDVDAPSADGFREVWLIDRDVTRLVSLGVLEGGSGRFTIPDALDLEDFVVVDVSEEPVDGDPAHSGDSVVRGLLDV